MDNTLSIKTENLGIRFFLKHEYQKGKKGLKIFQGKIKKEEFWVLRNINFEANKGEVLGIIGLNGSGKTTLLKSLARILPLTEGKLWVNGKIAPLIELGAGFNPELTGGENIFLSGTLLGLTNETIRKNYFKIVDFSGLEKFINIPLKNYSSGMFIRLAFSIVANLEPDIVLIDELFAVGDEPFQQKSFEKILKFKEKGSTLLMVSHDLNTIARLCNNVIVLDEGKIQFNGESSQGINHYKNLLKGIKTLPEEDEEKIDAKIQTTAETTPKGADYLRWGSGEIKITNVTFLNKNLKETNTFTGGEVFIARIDYVASEEIKNPVFGVAFYTPFGLLVSGPNTKFSLPIEKIPKSGSIFYKVNNLSLKRGEYFFSAAVYDFTLKKPYDHLERKFKFFVKGGDPSDFGYIDLKGLWTHKKNDRKIG
ncbi:MAG: ABC transporter ATP-binding protein [Candidatus Aminicenantes bacterium]|nr:ABC transporter ATP-binding protein [Candidatus Aminicenantes bacterium]